MIAFVRARPAKAVPRIASTCGVSSAAASPCSTRAPIRVDTLGANPHAADAAVKSPRPRLNIRRRPNMSPSRPAVMTPAATASPNPATIHCTALSLACRSRWVDGMATFTMKMSSVDMKIPVSTTRRVGQLTASLAAEG